MSKCFYGTRLDGSQLGTGDALPSTRALHSMGNGPEARAAETQLRTQQGGAATGLSWPPRGGPSLPSHQHVPVHSAYRREERSATCSSLAWQGSLVPALGARDSQGGEVKGCQIHREQPRRAGPCQPLGALYPRGGALLPPGSTVTPGKDRRSYAALAVPGS